MSLLHCLRILSAISVIGWGSLSYADPTIGTPTTAEAAVGTPNTVTFNHTIESDANLVLICLAERDTNASGFTVDTASVTVGGQAATQLIGQGNGATIRTVMFYRLAPPTGTQSISVTGDTGNDRLMVAAIAVINAAQTSTFNTAKGAGTTATTNMDVDTISSAIGELGVMCGSIRTSAITASADATSPVSTEQVDVAHSDSTSVRIFMYTEAGAATSIDMRVDASGSADWAATAVSIRASAGSTRRRLPIHFP